MRSHVALLTSVIVPLFLAYIAVTEANRIEPLEPRIEHATIHLQSGGVISGVHFYDAPIYFVGHDARVSHSTVVTTTGTAIYFGSEGSIRKAAAP